MYKLNGFVLRNTANAAKYSRVSSSNAVLQSIFASNQTRSISFDAAAKKAVGKYAADSYIASMNLHNQSIVSRPSVPTIRVVASGPTSAPYNSFLLFATIAGHASYFRLRPRESERLGVAHGS